VRVSIRRFLGYSFFLLAVFLFTKCSTSTLIDSWKDSELKSVDVKSILVLSINNSNSKRRIWEDTFVDALRKKGIEARPSYKYFPEEIPKADELNKIFAKNFDAVLMIKKVSEEDVKYRTPGYYYSFPLSWYRTPFYNRYSRMYMSWHVPGYFERDKVYDIETSIYHNSEDGKLIWTAVTKTFGIKPTQDFSKEVTNLVIPKMIRDGLITKN
jgi:hypothetical protein